VLVGSLACIVVFFLIPFRYLGLACVACLFSAPLTLRGSQSAAIPLPAEDSTVGRVLRLLDTLPTDEELRGVVSSASEHYKSESTAGDAAQGEGDPTKEDSEGANGQWANGKRYELQLGMSTHQHSTSVQYDKRWQNLDLFTPSPCCGLVRGRHPLNTVLKPSSQQRGKSVDLQDAPPSDHTRHQQMCCLGGAAFELQMPDVHSHSTYYGAWAWGPRQRYL
jgi:hypothetical protein